MNVLVISGKATSETNNFNKKIREVLDTRAKTKVEYIQFPNGITQEKEGILATVKSAFLRSDAVICEGSYNDIAVAYTTGMSSRGRVKPILILYNGSEKPGSSTLNVAQRDLNTVHLKNYTLDTIEDFVIEFLEGAKKYVGGKLDIRFTSKQFRYLSWLGERTEKDPSRVLKDCLDKIIEEDTKFQEIDKGVGLV